MERFFASLFKFDRDETTGEMIHFKLFELYMVYHIIWTVWYWGMYTLRISDVVLPLGIAQYIDITFMYGNSLPLVNAALISVLVFLTWFRLTPAWTYMLVLVLMHIQYVARYSLGEISHGAHMTAMTLFCFALGLLFFRSSKESRRFIMGAVFFFVGLSYVSAGVSKLIGTGPFWIDGRHLWLWMGEKGIDILSREGAFGNNWLQELAWTSRGMATLILLSGLLIELGGFLFWFERFRPHIATLTIGMHLGIMATMNIRFDASIAQLIVIGYPWALLFNYMLINREAVRTKTEHLLQKVI
ncbi:MAG: hypothetical protein EA364_02890 [Balneolaceae bacterium]|nr:MAG: hypothetical protein EA364_02890 [Balneolaceae bacterium]